MLKEKCWLSIVILISILYLTGCGSMTFGIHSLNAVVEHQGGVDRGMARVIAYLPPGGNVYGVNVVELTLVNMYGYATSQVSRKQGCVFVVPAGDYQMKALKKGKFLKIEESSDLILSPGQTVYLRIGKKGEAAQPINEEQAVKEIADNDIISRGIEIPSNGFVPKKSVVFRPYKNITDQKELEQRAKSFQEVAHDRSRLFILNDMGFGGNIASFHMGLDGRPREEKMKTETFYCYEVQPGHHVISLRGKLGGIDNTLGGYLVKTEAGRNYFFRLGKINHYLTSDEEGMKLVKKFDLVEKGFLEPDPESNYNSPRLP